MQEQHLRGPTTVTSAAAAAADAGGDNSQSALQRLVAAMQLLESQLHQFNTQSPAADQSLRSNIGHSTRSMLPCDNADTKIDELKQHYDAEVLLFFCHILLLLVMVDVDNSRK